MFYQKKSKSTITNNKRTSISNPNKTQIRILLHCLGSSHKRKHDWLWSNIFCVGIVIFSFITLWNIMSLVLSRRSCRVCQFMVFNISDTLLVLWCLLHVYLAARRCTFSSELMFSFVWGSKYHYPYTKYITSEPVYDKIFPKRLLQTNYNFSFNFYFLFFIY
jgi:hypothetical protein